MTEWMNSFINQKDRTKRKTVILQEVFGVKDSRIDRSDRQLNLFLHVYS